MASHYTREANRVRLSKVGMHKLANEKPTSIPSPNDPVRDLERKTALPIVVFDFLAKVMANPTR